MTSEQSTQYWLSVLDMMNNYPEQTRFELDHKYFVHRNFWENILESYVDRNNCIHLQIDTNLLIANEYLFPHYKNIPFENLEIIYTKIGVERYIKEGNGEYEFHHEFLPACEYENGVEFCIKGKCLSPTEWQKEFDLTNDEIVLLRLKYSNWRY